MKISTPSISDPVKGTILNSPTRLEKLARRTGWLQRQSKKLEPIFFVQGILHAVSQGNASFRLLAQSIGLRLSGNTQIDSGLDGKTDGQPCGTISKNALWERVTDPAVELFKGILQQLIQENSKQVSNANQIPALPGVNRIIAADSALLKMHKSLVAHFPATKNQNEQGGAGVRFQAAVDLITGVVIHFELTRYLRNDQSAACDMIRFIKRGDLILRDLGYFVIQSFNDITAAGAHYLSRHLTQRIVYHSSGNGGGKFDLLRYLQRNAPNPGDIIDIDISMGKERGHQRELECRLVARRIPPAAEEKRLRRIKQDEKRLGKQRSIRHKKFQGWEVYITSLPRDEVSASKVCEVYRLRWRIEIIFKAFKSYTPIKNLSAHDSNEHHVQVLIYAWLCLAVMAAGTGAFALAKENKSGVLKANCLSLLKVIPKVFQLIDMTLLINSAPNISEFMSRWVVQIEYHDRYEKRKNRTNMADDLVNILAAEVPGLNTILPGDY